MGPVNRSTGRYVPRALLAAAVCLFVPSQAQAFQLEFSDDSEWSGSLDMTLGYAASIRAQDADGAALDPANNLLGTAATPNYLSDARVPDSGDLISNVFKVNAELSLDWRNYGLVSSFAYQYDTEIMNQDTVDLAGNSAPWSEGAEDYAGSAFDVLDAYVYASFDIGENPLEVRAGKQVINWGEGLFFLDGVSTQVPLNINKLVTPGSELKEAYIGVESIYAQLGVGDVSSVEAYVQTDWRRAEFPPRGTFYGDDAFFRGGDEVDPLLGIPIRDANQEADDHGQWGISARTMWGEDTEVGFYYSRYHETFPFVTANNAGISATILAQIWPEDLDMFGVSFATTLGTWSVNGELAYRPDRPLFGDVLGKGFLNSDLTNVEEHDTWSASVHGIWLGGALPLGIDSQVVLVQFGMDYIDGDLSNLAAQNSITKEPGLTPDDLAYGVAVDWTGTWQAVQPGTDLALGLFLQYDIDGNSHFWGNFAEERLLGTLSLTANIGNEWEAKAGYTWVDQDNSHYETQDVINMSINYKF